MSTTGWDAGTNMSPPLNVWDIHTPRTLKTYPCSLHLYILPFHLHNEDEMETPSVFVPVCQCIMQGCHSTHQLIVWGIPWWVLMTRCEEYLYQVSISDCMMTSLPYSPLALKQQLNIECGVRYWLHATTKDSMLSLSVPHWLHNNWGHNIECRQDTESTTTHYFIAVTNLTFCLVSSFTQQTWYHIVNLQAT